MNRRIARALFVGALALGAAVILLGRVTDRPGDPARVAADPRFVACGIPAARAWLAFPMAHASDFSQHFPGWSRGADELAVSDPALVVISTGYEVPTLGIRNPSTTGAEPSLGYDLCIAVGPPANALVHKYGPTRFDGIRPDLDGPLIPVP